MHKLPVRKKNRLAGHDYSSAGRYFITICVKNRHELLWSESVRAASGRPNSPDSPILSSIGEIVVMEIQKIGQIYDNVHVDKYVVMPNHIHMILVLGRIEEENGRHTVENGRHTVENGRHTVENGRPKAAPTVSRIINQFKGSVSKQAGFSLWQKLFHDRIIRDDNEHERIAQYIENNPFNWKKDCFHPMN